MRITIIGSGNVATHLGSAFKNAGHRIVQVYSRDMHNAALLSYHVSAEAIDDLKDINPVTDVFIISVSDDAILPVARELAKHQKFTVHTSGATDLIALAAITRQAGVFYPLQTLSKSTELDFWQMPLCIEGVNEPLTSELEQLARTISSKVYRVDSSQRKVLHLAAVFACNFSNYMYDIAMQLLEKNKMDFDLIRPLIMETAQKIQGQLPPDAQTGPAVRNDETTMKAHLAMLEDEHRLKMLYMLISQGIITNKKAER